MVYYKKNYRRKTSRRTSRRNYNNTVAAKANKALYLAKKAQLQKELMYHTVVDTVQSVSSTGVLISLSAVSQGDDNNTRTGNVIYPSSLKLKGMVEMNASATSTLMRVIIFQWLNETPAAVTEYLNTASITSFKSEADRFNSRTLYDKTFQVSSGTVANKYIVNKIKLKGLIAYPESTSTPNKNGIYMLLISNEPTNLPNFNYETRLYYKDA